MEQQQEIKQATWGQTTTRDQTATRYQTTTRGQTTVRGQKTTRDQTTTRGQTSNKGSNNNPIIEENKLLKVGLLHYASRPSPIRGQTTTIKGQSSKSAIIESQEVKVDIFRVVLSNTLQPSTSSSPCHLHQNNHQHPFSQFLMIFVSWSFGNLKHHQW